jgi:hypothetical protein
MPAIPQPWSVLMRTRARLAAALLALALAAASCSGGGGPGATPTSGRPVAGGTADLGNVAQVQRRAFPAGGGSGVVASSRHPGVLWAIRDRGGRSKPGRPQDALYAYKVAGGRVVDVAPGAAFAAVPVQGAVPHDWEDIARDGDGNLWIADIGNNECDRTDTALLEVPEPEPAPGATARVAATYRYRFPDPPAGCAGRNAEAMFVVDGVPYVIDKADRSTVYRFPKLDPHGTVTLQRVGTLSGPGGGPVAKLSGADLSSDSRLLAVDTHTELYVYQAGVARHARGQALVADLIGHPPRWKVELGSAANVEGVGFSFGGHDLNLLAENRDVYWLPGSALEG